MRDRAIGIENEYGYISSDMNEPVKGPDGTLIDQNPITEVLKRGIKHGVHDGSRLWLPNGGCIYLDMNKVEWASPECRRVRDVVAYNKAAERIVADILKKEQEGDLFHFFKTNVALERKTMGVGDTYTSFGCHENYMTEGLPPPSAGMKDYIPLVPFLVTRQVYGGSGWWKHAKENEFRRAQRSDFMDALSGLQTTTQKSLLNERSEPHTSIHGLERFHLIIGDANMLEYALFLKVGATMLMMSLLEEGLLPRQFIRTKEGRELKWNDEVRTFREIAREPDLNQRILVLYDPAHKTWQNMSPLEVQTHYCELATRYVRSTRFPSEESEHEAHLICSMWSETLAALSRNDASFLEGRIDWFTKQRLVARAIKKAAADDSPDDIRRRIDVLYHEAASDSLYRRLVKAGIAVRITTDEEIVRAIHKPPATSEQHMTRASLRGLAVERELLEKATPTPGRQIFVRPSWEMLAYSFDETDRSYQAGLYGAIIGMATDKFPISHPLRYESEKFERFYRKLRAREPLTADDRPETVVLLPDIDYGYCG